MRRLFLFLPILAISLSLSAQPIGTDTVKNRPILIGELTREHISDSSWFKENYNGGIVTNGILSAIEKRWDSVSVEIFFGSWCDDSRYWVPAFLGLMDKTKKSDQIKLVALNRSKKSVETKKLGEIIEKVPTFVFWRNGVELGRIVESPEETLAKDMIAILKK